jgi:hypothetical protein
MAERIVSPGVFTKEIDQSFLAGAVAQIGASIVGPTVKGPALVPTQITSYGEFVQKFGSYTDDSYVPFAVNEYLRSGNVITVTRLLHEDGYKFTNGALAIIATSASVSAAVAVLLPTQPVTTTGTNNIFEDAVLSNGGSGSFAIKLSGSYTAPADDAIGFTTFAAAGNTAISASIVTSNNNYITKVFGKTPKAIDYAAYVAYENYTATSLFNNLGDVVMSLQKISNFEVLQDYSTAATPWITSQKIGSTVKNLFKFHTLSHGTSVNHEVKVAIRDIKTTTESADPDGYASFTVDVRRVNTANIVNSPYSSQDTDNTPDLLETYTNVNLNPNSSRYIERVIGNRYQSINTDGDIIVYGDYLNMSKFIRVEVDLGVSTRANHPSLIPFGFRAMSAPIPGIASLNLAAASYISTQTIGGSYSANNYNGFDFGNINNLNYLAPVPTSGSTVASNVDFYLGDASQSADAGYPSGATYSGSLQDALVAGTFTTNVALTTRKFIVPFQGGFDGARPNLKKYSGKNITATNTFGFDCSSATATGTIAYNKAFNLLANTDYYDINMLLTPGIIESLHPVVTQNARNLVENRQDAFYVMDSNNIDAPITEVVATAATLDSSYTATYWPWVRIINPDRNIPVWVPASVVMPGVLAFNDQVAAPWYAPAGLTRGGLTSVSDTYTILSQDKRNTLYEARVNPIANFPNEGICVWGQKTLQARPSALDRVNVRRLLITVKKFIASSTKYLVFEQNTTQTRNRFLAIANPYMEQVKAQQGLYAFRVVMDQTNNTPDLIDQNILYGQLFLQPTRTAEFIILDFNIQPTGANFPV